MSLRQMEQQFWEWMRQPPSESEAQDSSTVFRLASKPGVRSIDIYRRMYWFRQHEAMVEGFPRLRLAMGSQAFSNAVKRYLEKFPSSFHELERLGIHFPEFLADEGHSLLFSHLAQLEWSRTMAFLTPDVPSASLQTVAQNPRFSSLTLEFVPSFQLLYLHPLTFEYWQHPEKPLPPFDKVARRPLAVSRKEYSVSHEWVDPVEALALEAAQKGNDINALCNLFIENHQSPEQAMKWVSRWFHRHWIKDTAL